MADCVFCRIVSGEIPAAMLFEDDDVLVFLDINPVNPGHVLVIPKRHAENLLELEEGEICACAKAVQRAARAAVAVTGSPGFNLLQNNHRCAGQVVPHVHFHVIPRRPDDGFAFGWRQGGYAGDELEALRREMQARL